MFLSFFLMEPGGWCDHPHIHSVAQAAVSASALHPAYISVRGRISTFQAGFNKTLRLRLHQSCFVLHSDYSYSLPASTGYALPAFSKEICVCSATAHFSVVILGTSHQQNRGLPVPPKCGQSRSFGWIPYLRLRTSTPLFRRTQSV